MDLDGGCADAVAVILLEPGAGGLVAGIADDDVGVSTVRSTAFLAHAARPASLGAVWPFLRGLCDAEAVVAGVHLDIGWLLTL